MLIIVSLGAVRNAGPQHSPNAPLRNPDTSVESLEDSYISRWPLEVLSTTCTFPQQIETPES